MIQADNPILVSVVVPVYKIKEEYLRACVGSLLEQSLKEIEIILVDDGSPDRCGKICDKLAETDCRIRVIHQRNKGVSAARPSLTTDCTTDFPFTHTSVMATG